MIKNDHCYWKMSSRRPSVSAGPATSQPVLPSVAVSEKEKKKKRDTRKCVLCGVLGDCPPEVSDQIVYS